MTHRAEQRNGNEHTCSSAEGSSQYHHTIVPAQQRGRGRKNVSRNRREKLWAMVGGKSAHFTVSSDRTSHGGDDGGVRKKVEHMKVFVLAPIFVCHWRAMNGRLWGRCGICPTHSVEGALDMT